MTSIQTPVNEVRLVGRVSAPPATKILPSGDEIVSVNVVVRRDAKARARSKATVDTIECVAWTARLRSRLKKLEPGVQVEVTGALRRRFARTGAGATSFTSVELASFVVVPSAD